MIETASPLLELLYPLARKLIVNSFNGEAEASSRGVRLRRRVPRCESLNGMCYKTTEESIPSNWPKKYRRTRWNGLILWPVHVKCHWNGHFNGCKQIVFSLLHPISNCVAHDILCVKREAELTLQTVQPCLSANAGTPANFHDFGWWSCTGTPTWHRHILRLPPLTKCDIKITSICQVWKKTNLN